MTLGHRAGLRYAGTRHRIREHTPKKASRPNVSGPVGGRVGPVCRKSCLHGTRWPASGPTAVVAALDPCPDRGPSPLRGVISPIVGPVLVVGLHPISLGSGTALAVPGFEGSALLSPWDPVPWTPVFCDVVQCILCGKVPANRLAPLPNLVSDCRSHNYLVYFFDWLQLKTDCDCPVAAQLPLGTACSASRGSV